MDEGISPDQFGEHDVMEVDSVENAEKNNRLPASGGSATKSYCIVCNEPLTASCKRTIGEKALKTLLKASHKRQDGKHSFVINATNLELHNKCYIAYTNVANIKKARDEKSEFIVTNKQCFKEARTFNYDINCLICGRSKNHQTRKMSIITKVETVKSVLQEMNDNILNIDELSLRARLINLEKDFDNIKARYHALCLSKLYSYKSTNQAGRPISESMNAVTSYIIENIAKNTSECQFSINEILKNYEGDIPDFRNIKRNLETHFGDEIVIYHFKGDLHVCFRNSLGYNVNDQWYENKKSNQKEERLRIIEAAAHIALQDVRENHYDTSSYKHPSSFTSNAESEIPPTLLRFLEIIILTHKKFSADSSTKKWQNRILTLAHIIISFIRPNSFTSCILLGLSSMMHRKHASRALIDSLSNLGLCASYHETTLFEASIVKYPDNYKISTESFIQCIFDNADHNTRTIDGRNTFHAMGGILCVTPSSAVKTAENIPRLKELPRAADLVNSFPFLEMKKFENNLSGLQNVRFQRLDYSNKGKFSFSGLDFIWLFAKNKLPTITKGWHGFKGTYSPLTEYSVSKIIPLKFANAPPSDYDTILTTLIEAARWAKANNQEFIFVTFDLPLFLKALEILCSIDPDSDPYSLRSIILRLGGFHMLMSFLGSIGYVMEGSGLKEAFNLVFAEGSVDKILEGHYFSRAIRGHLLNFAAIGGLVIHKCNFSEEEIKYLDDLSKNPDLRDINLYEDSVFSSIKDKFEKQLELLKQNGPTAELFVQYLQLIILVLNYYHAERIGCFELHLECVEQMLPFFHSAGHNHYAKAAHLYLQEMLQLREKLSPKDYSHFVKEGNFAIRRSNKYWSGVWSDMVIEQVLMRSIKVTGGLTRGRGISESTIAMWIASTVILLEVCMDMENFCSTAYESSEQHADSGQGRKNRDSADLMLLIEFYKEHDPFPVTASINSIFSGLVGNSKINCHKAYDIGIKLVSENFDKTYGSIKFQRRNQVLPLSAMTSKVTLNNVTATVQPLLIFQRICINLSKEKDMKLYLSSELAPYPLSLFDENGMRKTNKSAFVDNFDCTSSCPLQQPFMHIVDGGFLLHQIRWQKNAIMSEILESYVNYVKKYFVSNSIIVFDGYDEHGTKDAERLRRGSSFQGREVRFTTTTKILVKANEFLSNRSNKSNLINLLTHLLNEAGYRTKIAEEDADVMIVQSALEAAKCGDYSVIIVGNDTDLLIILSQLSEYQSNILFQKMVTSKTPSIQYFTCNSFKYKELKEIVAFLYIFTGCDTTSTFYNIGKNKILQCLEGKELIKHAKCFYEYPPNCDEIIKNGSKIIKALYSNKVYKTFENKKQNTDISLNEMRFYLFERSTIKCSFKLENLPPTQGAAAEHCLRTYLQLQTWLGKSLDPLEYGWEKNADFLRPTYTKDSLIPDDIAKTIFCRCVKSCGKSCGCRKRGLQCSKWCAHCQGESCNNSFNIAAEHDLMQNGFEEKVNESELDNFIMEDSDDISQPNKKKKISSKGNLYN